MSPLLIEYRSGRTRGSHGMLLRRVRRLGVHLVDCPEHRFPIKTTQSRLIRFDKCFFFNCLGWFRNAQDLGMSSEFQNLKTLQ